MEAFVTSKSNLAYREFNLSPSGEWAAYAFSDYRCREPDWVPMAIPRSTTQTDMKSYWQLEAQIPYALLPCSDIFQVGLSAVIETQDGQRTYWALHHSGPQPDFHDRAGFCLNIPIGD